MYFMPHETAVILEGCLAIRLFCMILAIIHTQNPPLTLCILDTPKEVLWHTVKMQMKCSIMLHFIKDCTVCERLKQPSGTEIHHNLENAICDP